MNELTNRVRRVQKAVINDRRCHHVCFTWQSSDGNYAFYLDGKSIVNKKGLSKGKPLPGGGVLSLAQRRPRLKLLRFALLKLRFVGKINDLNIWNRVLSAKEVKRIEKCGSTAVGNVKSWSDFKIKKQKRSQRKYAKYVFNGVCPKNC